MDTLVGPNHFYLGAEEAPLYYQVKPVTAFFLSLSTWGLYAYWWQYQNWRRVKNNTEGSISPFFRSFFHPLFAYSLYDRVADTSNNLNLNGVLFLRFLGVFHVLSICLPVEMFVDFYSVFSLSLFFISTFDLVLVQIKVREINQALGLSIEQRFVVSDFLSLLLIVCQCLLFYMVV